MTDRFVAAIAAIDAANADDPNTINVRGELRPKELAHAEMVTEWVRRLAPEASEELLLAARGHHLRRWTVPRTSYPEGRSGYLKWRKDLHAQHARELAAIVVASGYDDATAGRVGAIVRKEHLRRDEEVQVLEDALCLVFLETQLGDMVARFDDDKVVDILRKSIAKMSDAGRAAALGVELPAEQRALVERALA